MELELGQDVAEIWKVLILNQRWISSSNSAIFENNTCILCTGSTDYSLEYHLLLGSREVVKYKQMFVCISIRTPHSQDLDHHWKICHHMQFTYALLRCDMLWLSGASAISDWYTKWGVMVSAQKTQARPTNKYLDFQSAAETGTSPSMNSGTAQGQRHRTPFQRRGGETPLRVHLTYVTLKAVLSIADVCYICSS